MLGWSTRRERARARQLQAAAEQDRAEQAAAMQRILDAPGGTAPTTQIRTGPLLTRGEAYRPPKAGR